MALKVSHTYVCPSHGVVLTVAQPTSSPATVDTSVRCVELTTHHDYTEICGQVAAWTADTADVDDEPTATTDTEPAARATSDGNVDHIDTEGREVIHDDRSSDAENVDREAPPTE